MSHPATVKEVARTPGARGLLILLILVTFFFTVLALLSQRANSRQDTAQARIEANQKEIRDLTAARQKGVQDRAKIDYATCLDTAELHRAFYTLIGQSIKQTQAAPVTDVNSAKAKASSLDTLKDLLSHIKIPECGSAPSATP